LLLSCSSLPILCQLLDGRQEAGRKVQDAHDDCAAAASHRPSFAAGAQGAVMDAAAWASQS